MEEGDVGGGVGVVAEEDEAMHRAPRGSRYVGGSRGRHSSRAVRERHLLMSGVGVGDDETGDEEGGVPAHSSVQHLRHCQIFRRGWPKVVCARLMALHLSTLTLHA